MGDGGDEAVRGGVDEQLSHGDYAPSRASWVRDQVAQIEAAGDTAVVGVEGRSVILVTMLGRRSGKVRKLPVMRVEAAGRYAALGSLGGAPKNPAWVGNLRANPDVLVQDGTRTMPMRAREVEGAERHAWWVRAVEAFPDYAAYQARTQRQIPIFVLEPR